MGSYANPALKSVPAPEIKALCLPEGKRILSVTIDFSTLPLTNPFLGPAPGPQNFKYPELAVVNNELSILTPLGGGQIVDVDLGKLQASYGLTVVRSMIYYYRPLFQNGFDFTARADCPVSLLCTNLDTHQTVVIGHAFAGNYMEAGCVPFFGNSHTRVRFLNGNTDPINPPEPVGKGIFHFCNFDLPPYTMTGQYNG